MIDVRDDFGMIGMNLRQMGRLFWEMGEGGDEFVIVGTCDICDRKYCTIGDDGASF